jgi:peroxiredoxin Q/BCP
MLEPGSKAPDFVVQDGHGRDVTLTDLLADGPLILYFYPADFTPGCTREACQIRDLHGDIQGAGLDVVGLSPQDPASHRHFSEKHNLPFRLLCDPDKVVIRMYDVDGPFGVGVRRATFLIDQDRTIRDAVLADVRINKHAEFIEKAIALHRSAASGERQA